MCIICDRSVIALSFKNRSNSNDWIHSLVEVLYINCLNLKIFLCKRKLMDFYLIINYKLFLLLVAYQNEINFNKTELPAIYLIKV